MGDHLILLLAMSFRGAGDSWGSGGNIIPALLAFDGSSLPELHMDLRILPALCPA